jgi:hypothetical protein
LDTVELVGTSSPLSLIASPKKTRKNGLAMSSPFPTDREKRNRSGIEFGEIQLSGFHSVNIPEKEKRKKITPNRIFISHPRNHGTTIKKL